ncbi:hypothetical protein IQ273_07770 [Nodosilinea sp. LEGE 07298]|uniref:PD-(D/E)XK nuclease domain-containing protein n=1 Tax=Nodosilinea sp. LEGE 07298 TaxID=2777970 RepID=UPI00188046F8|nr:hypothetical protein [Nodosilinea sp. LEGE 07298]MBE9109311.1 hypothetical protein [Nodosilinea sp. LEGE 07298]
MDLSKPSECFWHCSVQLSSSKAVSVANDLTFEELHKLVVSPWLSGTPFVISGTIVRSSAQVVKIRVAHTDKPMEYYAKAYNERMRVQGIADMSTNRRLLPFSHGTDLTFELLFSGAKLAAPEPDEALVEQLCRRLPQSARILGMRSRKGKASYEINDEYDVQDLLHALIRSYIKYSVQEDPLPKVAGAKSSRADISIEDLGILIELKYVHGPDDQKRLFEEFSQDLVLYAQWKPLKTLIYVIYNSADLRDPEALEKLSSETEINGKRFAVKVVLV